ncbi:hemerythrin domain-containing protein [Nitratifractor sp.]
MLSSLFESKGKRLVKRWNKDHEQLVVLGNKVIAEYVKGNQEGAKKTLKQFTDAAMEHLTNEDVEMYRLLRDLKLDNEKITDLINEFQDSFKETKRELMKFLSTYVKNDAPLDEAFFEAFQELMETLGERIEYEEHNLYFYLSLS